MLNSIVRDLRQNWKPLALTDILYKIIAYAILTPIAAGLFQAFVWLSGRTVLADDEILHFFITPWGWLCLIAVGAVTIAIVALEQTALMKILAAARQGRRASVIEALQFTVERAWPVLQLATRITAWSLLIAAPFLLAAGGVYWALLTRHDINFFLTEKPAEFWVAIGLGVLIGLAFALVAVRLASAWLFALPLVLFETIPPKDALSQSRRRSVGRRFDLTVTIAAWAGACFLLGLVGTAVVNWMGRIAVPLASGSLTLLLFAVGCVLSLWLFFNIGLSLLSTTAFSSLLMNWYWQLGGVTDDQRLAGNTEKTHPALRLTRGRLAAATIVAAVAAMVVGLIVFRGVRLQDSAEITAHRGASASAPENTMAAVMLAIDEGADWVEIDVQETADGQVVVMHDSDFKKIAGQDLKIWDATMDDLKDLDIGSWFSPQFSGQRVPTLEQVLLACHEKIGVVIELKSYGHGQQLEQRVVDIVEKLGVQNDIVIMSLKRKAVKKVKSLRPHWTVGLLTAVAIGDLIKEDADFLAVSQKIATSDFIDSAHRADKRVYVWTVNKPLDISVMMSRGADNLITDYPAVAVSVRKERASMSAIERLLLQMAIFFGGAA